MATFAQIAGFTRSVLQTDSTDLPDSIMLVFANEATQRIVNLKPHWPHLYTEGTLSVVAGTFAYTLASASFSPQTYTAIESVWDDNGFGTSLEELDYQEASRYWIGSGFTNSNMPNYFATYGGKLYLYPKPSGTRTFRIGGYRDIVDMVNAGDLPDLPTPFHNAVQYGCVSLAQAQQEDYQGSQYWAQLANTATSLAIRNLFNNRLVHRPAQLYGRGGPRFVTYPDWVRSEVT